MRKRGNQCMKEDRLSHSRCFFSSERPKMTGGERSGRSSNHVTKGVCFLCPSEEINARKRSVCLIRGVLFRASAQK
jgi:hypothetical protein